MKGELVAGWQPMQFEVIGVSGGAAALTLTEVVCGWMWPLK